VFLGEAPSSEEILQGLPFVGQAGGMLNRLLRLMGLDRNLIRIDNTIRCAPPMVTLDGQHYQHAATHHCRQHTSQTLEDPSAKVIVSMGGSAIRRMVDLPSKGVRVQDLHGGVWKVGDKWVVGTFHPSFLQRGAHNLIGTTIWDLQRAQQILKEGWAPDPGSLVVDPSYSWAEAWARGYLEACQQSPEDVWLAVDIETPDKAKGQDEGKLTAEDQSFTILRVNLCCHPDEGVTLPYTGEFIPLIHRVLEAQGRKLFWNEEYDLPRLLNAGVRLDLDRCWDLMWAWHALQSDLPRGLGFVAPFYSTWGPWKHLSGSDPGTYAAIDGLQTLRIGFGVVQDLIQEGMWEVFETHMHTLKRRVLQPAREVGIAVDRPGLEAFLEDLTQKTLSLDQAIQTCVPEALRPLTPKGGLKSPPSADQDGKILHTKARATTKAGVAKKDPPDPTKLALFASAELIAKVEDREVLCCQTCGAQEIQSRHRCPKIKGEPQREPQVGLKVAQVTRYYWREPFNPESPQQLLSYILGTGGKPGRAKKTGNLSADRDTLGKLWRETKDPLYHHVLQKRAVAKVRGTYVLGTLRRLDPENRLHPEGTYAPSTFRLSYVNPNIQNVVGDRQEETLASGFRRCITATSSCRLIEIDYSGIEAVLVGWFARDPHYIRLAWCGVHAGLASHVLGKPYDPAWDDITLKSYLKGIKGEAKHFPGGNLYDQAKRTVHGDNYGLTEFGMVRNFPKFFPSLEVARRFKRIYRQMAPKIPAWQAQIREYAHTHHFLGGPGDPPFGHPFKAKHRFWSVVQYQRITYAGMLSRRKEGLPVVEIDGGWYAINLGEDGKRAVAFFPQSTARFILTSMMMRLFGEPDHLNYIGEAYFGRTPLRAPIHDSILLEVPALQVEEVLEKVFMEMLRPIAQLPCPEAWGIGPYLRIGAEAKLGKVDGNWQDMEEIPTPPLEALGLTPSSIWVGEHSVAGDLASTPTFGSPDPEIPGGGELEEDLEDQLDFEMPLGMTERGVVERRIHV